MATVAETRVPTWFWLVSALALLWSLLGVGGYLMDVMMSAEDAARLPEAQRTLREAQPAWATGAYAVAVFSCLAGAIALLMRRSWARPLFALSLVGIVLTFSWYLLVARAQEVLGLSAVSMPALVFVIGVALLWFAGLAIRRGWLR